MFFVLDPDVQQQPVRLELPDLSRTDRSASGREDVIGNCGL